MPRKPLSKHVLRTAMRRQYGGVVSGEPYRYVEVLASIVDDDGQRTYVVRALSVDALAELAADLTAAQARGEGIEDTFASWALVYD